MLRFVVRRLLLLVPILIGLSILVFLWIRALPGSPAEALLGERATEQTIEQVREQYGLDGRLVRAEAERLQARHPDAWEAGRALLERIGLH